MGSFQDIMDQIAGLSSDNAALSAAIADSHGSIQATNLKLDEVLAFIQSLQAGQPITQAQIDQGLADIQAARAALQGTASAAQTMATEAGAVLAEADTLDGTP